MWTIAVDSGKFMTKAVAGEVGTVVTEENYFSALTRWQKTKESHSLMPGYGEVVTINEKSYVLGLEDGDIDVKPTKEEDIHKYFTYFSISKLVPNGEEIKLVIGCPVEHWKSPDMRKTYEAFMLNIPKGEVYDPSKKYKLSFQVEGENYEYTVTKITAMPEASGYLFKHLEQMEKKIVAIIDIGGLNVNGTLFRGDSPLLDSWFTTKQGGNTFTERLFKELNAHPLLKNGIMRELMDEIVEQGFVEINGYPEAKEMSQKLITEFKQQFVEEIKEEMYKKEWSPALLTFVFIGGGSLLFTEEIQNTPEFGWSSGRLTISDNAQWDNVEGWGILAGLVFPSEEEVPAN